jgi:signal-transduction protein with cAMP-binding, CBS, and nucleotidyltransferase domain
MEKKLSTSVKEFITPHLLSVAGERTLHDAASLMSSINISSLVVEEDEHPVGIITERDIIRAVAANVDLNATLVRDKMTKKLIAVESTKPVQEALLIMSKENIRHLLVQEHGRYIGMFSFKNFLDLERLRIGII